MRILWLRYRWLRALGLSVQFLTRMPLPSSFPEKLEDFQGDMGRSTVFLPVVGALIGASTGLVLSIGFLFWPFEISVLLALAVELRLTGALHEDAVADFCDAFGSENTAEDTLNVLKDSRIGTYGLLGLGLAFSLRAAGLMAIEAPGYATFVLILSGSLSRFSMIAFMITTPVIANRSSINNSMAPEIGRKNFILSFLVIAPIFIVAFSVAPTAMFLSLFLQGIFLCWFRKLVIKRLGGSTGDCAGTVGYCGMLIITLIFVANR